MLNKVTDKSIDEQGERMVPAFHEQQLVFGEHLSRYLAASEIVKNKEVLDIASGSGYGSYLLSKNAKIVYGVDNYKPTIEYSKRNYSKENIEFLHGTAEKIPLKDNTVDVVVSFETIEHIENYHEFIKEIKRVLRPDGYLIISTPNDYEFPEGNHFHKHEFYPDELKTLLGNNFKHTKFYYQFTWLYNALLSEGESGKEWKKQLTTHNSAPVKDDKAVYMVAICSNKEIKNNLEIKPVGILSEIYSAKKIQTEKQNISNEINTIKKELKSKNNELSKIYNSRGWKLLEKFYRTKINIKKYRSKYL